MIRTMQSLGSGSQFESARWCANGDRTKSKTIRLEVVSEREKQYNAVMQGFKLCQGSTVIRTTYCAPFNISDELYYHNTWWIIKSVNTITQDIAPQAMAVSNYGIHTQYILELAEVS